MKTKIRTEPVSLNESTLETNIVAEIAALFICPRMSFYSARLHWFFDIPNEFPITQSNKRVKIYRLTPPEEYDGGGWDSKIVIPNVDGTQRAVFIQFKRGKHSESNTIPNSLFNIELQNPNKHAEFTFNDNSGNTQHQTLKNLHKELVTQGFPSKSVIYGFPRITDLETFNKLEEDLLLHTTFLSISEMDNKATANQINLYDGNIHHFRTCYYDETKREISSNPFSIDNNEDTSGLLYEILLVKFAHWRNQLSKALPITVINEEFFLLLADFLRINPFKLYDFEYFKQFSSSFEMELNDYYTKVENKSIKTMFKYFGGNNNNQENIKWRKVLFKRITRFVNERQDGNINIQNDIPAYYTFTLSEEKVLEMSFEQEATYNLLVF